MSAKWPEGVRARFHALLDLDVQARAERLDELARTEPDLARELAELLRHAEGGGQTFEHALRAAPAAVLDEALTALPTGTRLGPWRVVEPIGSGGMGAVYLAERADGAFEMRVAVKLIRMDRGRVDEWLATERRVLARLDHPGIARLLDGGVTEDGRAYLVMEWVPGEDLDAARPEGDRRLEVFVQIADAVAHAHQRLVVHGDIKPGNVRIMPDGRARLLDFGVARLLGDGHQNPHRGGLALTPAFAAPEQLAGRPATTQTDVWALGALLRWLVTEGDGPAQRELAAIIRRATAEDPVERYATVAALQEDVQRVLAHEPIRAAPTGLPRRVSLWARRNPLAAGLSVVVLTSVLTGTALLAWQARIVAAERDVARVEASRWELLRDQLVMLFSEAALGAEDPDLSARGLLDASAAMAEDWLADDPAGRAQMQATLAGLYIALEDFPSAQPLLEAFIAGDDGTAPPAMRGRAYVQLANVLHRAGEVDRAFELAERGRAILEPLPGEHGIRLSEAYQILGRVLRSQSRLPESITALERGVDLAASYDGQPNRMLAAGQSNLAITLGFAGDTEDALAWFEESLETWRALGLESTSDALNVMNNLAVVLHQQGRIDEAEPLFEEVIGLRSRRFGESGALGALLSNYGVLLVHRYRTAEAREHLERAQTLLARFAGEGSPQYGLMLMGMGNLERVAGNVAAADERFAQAEATLAAALGPDHLWPVLQRVYRAVLLRQIDPEAAADAIAEAIGWLEAAGPPAQAHLAAALCEQAMVHLDHGDPELALEPARRCREIRQASLSPDGWQHAEAEAVLAAAELAAGHELAVTEVSAPGNDGVVDGQRGSDPAADDDPAAEDRHAAADDEPGAAARLRASVAELEASYGEGHPRLLWFQRLLD